MAYGHILVIADKEKAGAPRKATAAAKNPEGRDGDALQQG